MHGRVKKDIVELPPEEKEKQRQQVRTARSLFGNLLEQRQACAYSQQTFDMTSKALQFHPEFPTLWGYRREILLSGKLADGNSKAVLQDEMKLLEKALRKSQKVYSIWFHRKWVVEKLFEICGAEVKEAKQVLDTELDLCGRLLEVDERNFHCWNHRAHVMGLMRRAAAKEEAAKEAAAKEEVGTVGAAEPPLAAEAAAAAPSDAPEPADTVGDAPPASDAESPPEGEQPAAADAGATGVEEKAEEKADEEAAAPLDLLSIDLKVSKDLINRNFSNYSAWHLRALLQQPPLKDAGQSSGDAEQPAFEHPIDIASELEWVQQGIYTEPNDQSVWLYHHWLTTLGRGCEQARITHCAAMGGELFVFFSQQVCARGEASVRRSSPGSPVIAGSFEPLGPDAASGSSASALHRRIRPLPAGRRRWLHGWRFVPEPGQGLERVTPTDELHIEATIEELGSLPDGAPARGSNRVAFTGRAVCCDAGADGPPEAPSPALDAILAVKPSEERLGVLEGELARVEELLEIEPDCRWALLARGRLATSVVMGAEPERVEAAERKVADGYKRIAELDPLRQGFYQEAQAGCQQRLRALAWLQQAKGAAGFDTRLDFSGLSLRHLSPPMVLPIFGVRHLDVSRTGLTVLGPLLQLCSLEELVVADNCLTGDLREVFALPRLRRFDASSNALELREAPAGVEPPAPPESFRDAAVSGNPAILQLMSDGGEKAVLERLSRAGEGDWVVYRDPGGSRLALRRGVPGAA